MTAAITTCRFFSKVVVRFIFEKGDKNHLRGINSIKAISSDVIKSYKMEPEKKRSRSENKPPVIGTHNGTFHCDEVLACFMLRQLPEYKDATVFRSRDVEALREKCDIIVDVGAEFDHEKKWYDHHQNKFKESFSSLRPEFGSEFEKIRLSSAGLIYVYYGERVVDNILRSKGIELSPENLKLSYWQIYKSLISEIDAIDNGIPMLENGSKPLYKISTHLSARIHHINPSWEEDMKTCNVEERFERAVATVGKEFVENVLQHGGPWIRAREYVRKALENAKSAHESGEILILERFCPWKSHLADLEKEYKVVGLPKMVIFQENEKSWRIAGVPIEPGSFLGRKFFPKEWRGYRDEKLSEIAGIPNLIFVHYSGFIGGASTKESALAMAIKCVEWNTEEYS